MVILTILTEVINSTLNLFLAYWLFGIFWQKRLNNFKTIVFFLVIDILHVTILLLSKGSFIYYAGIFLLTFSLSLIFEAKIIYRFVYTALFYAITAAVEIIVAMLITKIFNMDFNEGKQGVLLIVGVLLSKFVSFLIIMAIKIKKHSRLLTVIRKNPISIFAFPISTFAIIILQHAIFTFYPVQNDIISIAVLICYSILLMANVLIFDFINTLYENTINESKIVVAEELISNQSEYYHTILKHHNEISTMRHNHRNFCLGLLHELNHGNIDKVAEFIKEEQKLTETSINLPTDIINAILIFKTDKAHEQGVNINYEIRGLRNINVSSVDLAIVLGNALDNAIEATAKLTNMSSKTIEVLAILRNNTILITIKNPVIENINTNYLSTTKGNKQEHGYGIISMKQIADRYYGDIMFSCVDNIFTTTVLLQNIDNKK